MAPWVSTVKRAESVDPGHSCAHSGVQVTQIPQSDARPELHGDVVVRVRVAIVRDVEERGVRVVVALEVEAVGVEHVARPSRHEQHPLLHLVGCGVHDGRGPGLVLNRAAAPHDQRDQEHDGGNVHVGSFGGGIGA